MLGRGLKACCKMFEATPHNQWQNTQPLSTFIRNFWKIAYNWSHFIYYIWKSVNTIILLQEMTR